MVPVIIIFGPNLAQKLTVHAVCTVAVPALQQLFWSHTPSLDFGTLNETSQLRTSFISYIKTAQFFGYKIPKTDPASPRAQKHTYEP